MAYVGKSGSLEDEQKACFLCHHASAPPDQDEGNLVLQRGEHAFVVLNLYPYNSGHLMVAPYSHTGDLPRLDPASGQDLWQLTQRVVAILQREYRPDGFNLGMNLGRIAGAGLPDHLHVHIVPRWSGDTNFMPVVGDTKVIPETPQQTFQRLKPHF